MSNQVQTIPEGFVEVDRWVALHADAPIGPPPRGAQQVPHVCGTHCMINEAGRHDTAHISHHTAGISQLTLAGRCNVAAEKGANHTESLTMPTHGSQFVKRGHKLGGVCTCPSRHHAISVAGVACPPHSIDTSLQTPLKTPLLSV